MTQKKIPVNDPLRDKALKMLKFDEGERFIPYLCPAGKRTIGIGHNIDANGLPEVIDTELKQNGSISPESSRVLFEIDISGSIADAEAIFGNSWQTFGEARRLAVLNMLFAMGRSGFLKWTNLIRHIRAGQWLGASKSVLDSAWARQQAPGRARRVATLMRMPNDFAEPLTFDFSILKPYL